MNRKLAWACGILVLLGLAVRAPSESFSPTGAAQVAPVRSGSSVEPKRAPEPLPKATPSEGPSGGKELLDAIRRGEDPLLRLARTPEEQAERKERQVRARQEADRIRARQIQAAAQQERLFEEHRARLIQAGFDPDLPGPGRAAGSR